MQNNTKNKAIAGLVLGIISTVFGIFGSSVVTPPIGLVLGIVAIVLSVKVRALNDENKNLATAGLVLGIIGVVYCAITTITCTLCLGCTACFAASSGATELADLLSY